MPGVHSSRECFELEDALIERETAKAILVKTDADEDGIWIPLSQVDKITHGTNGRATIRMTNWIAKEKGLI